jgi:ABC-type nitrate/sulfonate/bicarbonate transport system substrate-binding protein
MLVLACMAWAGTVFGLERVSVQLLWKHQFEFAAFYAAEAKGYYRDAGLTVDILEGGPGIDTVSVVASGKADFGVGTSALVVDRFHGKPVSP